MLQYFVMPALISLDVNISAKDLRHCTRRRVIINVVRYSSPVHVRKDYVSQPRKPSEPFN